MESSAPPVSRSSERSTTSAASTATLVAPDVPGLQAKAGWGSSDDAPTAGPIVTKEDAVDSEQSPQRAPAIWWLLAGVGISLLLAFVVSARTGTLGIAATLAIAGVFRVVLHQKPAGLTIRGRTLDALMYFVPAAMIGTFSVIAPIS